MCTSTGPLGMSLDDATDEQGRKADPFLGGRGRRHAFTALGRCLLRRNRLKAAPGKDGRATDHQPTNR